MPSSALAAAVLLGLATAANAGSPLTQDQRKWLLSVSATASIPGAWPGLSASQLSHTRRKVRAYEKLFNTYHHAFNQSVEVVFSDRERTKTLGYGDVGDSTCWTGHYLAAMAHKYATTGSASALEAVRSTLHALHRLARCTGKRGFFARFVGPSDDPPYYAYYHGSDHAYVSATDANATWLGSLSRDMYLGAGLGLSSVLALVDDAEATATAKAVIEEVADTLIRDLWSIVSPQPSLPINPTPGFAAVWMRLALSANPDKYNHVFLKGEYAGLLRASLALSFTVKSLYHSYYPNNLCIIGLYSMALLEDSPSLRTALLHRLRSIALHTAVDHLTVTFPVMYGAAAKHHGVALSPADADAVRGLVQGLVADFPDAPNWKHSINQTANPDYPHKTPTLSAIAMLPSDRQPRGYMWQRGGVNLLYSTTEPAHEYPGLDAILPYWIARYAGMM